MKTRHKWSAFVFFWHCFGITRYWRWHEIIGVWHYGSFGVLIPLHRIPLYRRQGRCCTNSNKRKSRGCTQITEVEISVSLRVYTNIINLPLMHNVRISQNRVW
jgi:hypothetical protein